MKNNTNQNRRHFLKSSVASMMGASTLGGALSFLNQAQAAVDPGPSDYKALVCIFLYGGNDSFNMLVPNTNAEYNAYSNSRQNMAIAKDQLLAISPNNAAANSFGLHPSLASLKPIFDSGDLAFLANVGPLVQPTTRDQFLNKSVTLPKQLFSHSDQQTLWQAAQNGGNSSVETGWSGRMAEEFVANGTLPINITTSGFNLFQSNAATGFYSLSANGLVAMDDFEIDGTDYSRRQSRRETLRALIAQAKNQSHPLNSNYGGLFDRALDLNVELQQVYKDAPAVNTEFPVDDTGNTTKLGAQLQTIARTIAARDGLQMNRQVFFASMGGWDTHADQLTRQPYLLKELSDAMASFNTAIDELGLNNNVTSFTASDFGRTLTSNGDGTDHAWAGVQMMMGGAVDGQKIYGQYPVLELDGQDDAGNSGRIIPTTSIEQYSATLASWFGVPANKLDTVFPNLNAFGSNNLGFLSS